jgi:hypothetical protein
VFLNYFVALISKIIFLKKYYFDAFLSEKTLLKATATTTTFSNTS